LSDGDTGVAGELFIEMVEAERYEETLGVSVSASRAEATAAFIRLSGRYSGQDRVLIALNKARSAMLSETEVQKGVRLSRLKYLDKLRRHEEELASYDRALAIDPEDSTAWYNKGRTLSQLGRHEEALDAHDRALAIDPFDSATWFQKGLTLYELGRHEEALGPYDCALDTLARRLYFAKAARFAFSDSFNRTEKAEVNRILRLAKSAPPSEKRYTVHQRNSANCSSKHCGNNSARFPSRPSTSVCLAPC
jgi:tetratricopeptide (TPR) repeat protein